MSCSPRCAPTQTRSRYPPDTVPTQPPTASDGPLAQDEELLTDHAFKEEDPEELSLEALESRRDALLQSRAQRRPPRALRLAASLARHPWARGVAATVLVGSMALGAWALRPEPSPPALPTPPAAALAAQPPPPVAASPASPHLAPPGASPPKEGSTVKTPQSPNSSTPTATTSPSRSVVRSASKGALCAAGLAVAGCASVPVRPTQQECPPGANKFMDAQRWGWSKTQLLLKPNTRMNQFVTLKPGPIISVGESDVLGGPPPGSLFRGHVYFAEDGRVVIRYTEVELKGGERVPVCFAVVDRDDVTIDLPEDSIKDRTEDSVTVLSDQVANRVRVLPD